MNKYKEYDKTIKELHSKGLRNFEIAKEIGIDGRRVSDRLKAMELKSNKRQFNDKPTKDEEKIFRSMFLGDGAIYKSKANKNYRVNLAHSLKQKDYFLMKYNRVKDFIGTEYFKETQFHKKMQKEYHVYKFQSKVNPYFTRMYKKWYRNGKKIIPNDIEEYFDAELLAYKFFDDGSLHHNGYYIATDDYDKKSLNNLRRAMLKNHGIKTNIHKHGNDGKVIYIPSTEVIKFKKIVEPYATKDVLYKLGEFRETLNK